MPDIDLRGPAHFFQIVKCQVCKIIGLTKPRQNPGSLVVDLAHRADLLAFLFVVMLIDADRINLSKRSVQVTGHLPLEPDQCPESNGSLDLSQVVPPLVDSQIGHKGREFLPSVLLR